MVGGELDAEDAAASVQKVFADLKARGAMAAKMTAGERIRSERFAGHDAGPAGLGLLIREMLMKANRAERQRFSIGYHLNSWDLAGLPLQPALEFLAGQGFGWFEILAGNSLSDQFARKYMALGNQAPPGVVTDTDILRRFALLSQAERARHPPLLALRQRHLHQPGGVAL